MAGALDGLRVLDLSRILAGPLVGQMLGDLGAEVIKVERPGRGDDARAMGPPFLADGNGEEPLMAGFYLSCNRNKKSVAVDFARPEGQNLVRRMARECDVLIENFKVGTLARFGLDYERLRAEAPGLIYCSITGFGQTGPYANKPGYDGIFQAMSGLMSVSGHPDGALGAGPMKVGISIVDILTAHNAVIAILAALRHRDAKGGGQALDISLLDCGVAALSHFAQNYLVSGEVPERRGNGGYGGIPSQAFQCADRAVFVVVGNNAQYSRFCQAIGRPDLIDDERFRTGPLRIMNRRVMLPILDQLFARRSAAEWVELLDAAEVPVSLVNDVAAAFRDPQVEHRGMIVERAMADGTPLKMVANPLRFSVTPIEQYAVPPSLGQDSETLFADWLGLDAATLSALRRNGTIA